MTFTIKVSNIAWTLAPKDLRRFAREQGKVRDAILYINKATGLSTGTGIITYEDRSVAERLLRNRNGIVLGGRTLRFSRHPVYDAGNNNANANDISDDIIEKEP